MVPEVSHAELQAVRDNDYRLDDIGPPPAGMIDRPHALDLIRRNHCSSEAEVASLSFGMLVFVNRYQIEPSYGALISRRPVWLAVVHHERTPVLGGRRARLHGTPTSFLEERWLAIDARTAGFLISCSMLV